MARIYPALLTSRLADSQIRFAADHCPGSPPWIAHQVQWRWTHVSNHLIGDGSGPIPGSFDEATREYAELEALLAGGTLSDLDSQSRELQQRVAALEADLGELPELPTDVNLDEEVRRAEKIAHDAAHLPTAAETQARERANDVPSVAEAEEACNPRPESSALA